MSQQQTAQQVLSKALIKQTITIELFEQFRAKMNWLCASSEETRFEDYHKQNLIQFFKDTQFRSDYYINISDHIDLVIHNGKKAKDPIGVLIETKRPSNTAEMPTPDNLNKKGLQELLLYYLRERITAGNLELKQLIVTNNLQWLIFDGTTFERLVVQNKGLVKRFEQYRDGDLSLTRTDEFYREIAAPFLDELLKKDDHTFKYVYEDVQIYNWAADWDAIDPAERKKQIAIYRLFSPEHLLKLPVENDSNTLNKAFYTELLHLIGLTEVSVGNKKLIQRKQMEKRDNGSLLESAIFKIRPHLHEVESIVQYGESEEEQLLTMGLELTITWINRILFLKLLEAQLVTYDAVDHFLNQKFLDSFADLDTLFFNVLAIPINERDDRTQNQFGRVPYLNSSLFERTELERQLITMGSLKLERLSVHPQTVLKDRHGKKTGMMLFHEYLFDFLNAYDFGRDSTADVLVEESKKLINASVLGLIFEKINGYKDGSFFTPGQITMYMCRETLQNAVVQKFNAVKGWNCVTLDDVYDKLESGRVARDEANSIINTLRICDPAVGSGHFLVSALNELIAIKHKLKILQDANGWRLKEYDIVVENDELLITEENGDLFQYHPNNTESHRVQQTLFHEKQTLIENCLFGVDINLNSVKICRLRLWIELLKHAYFKNGTELETLPNIDINIKHGDSLISRFDLNADLSSALKQHQLTVESYRKAVNTYRNAKTGEEKQEMERLIALIKGNLRQELRKRDHDVMDLQTVNGQLSRLLEQTRLLEETKAQQKARVKKQKELQQKISDLEKKIAEKRDNTRYKGAFEWRFEFPEILDESGDFVGFDTIVGNPPYGAHLPVERLEYYKKTYPNSTKGVRDIYKIFVEKSLSLVTRSGIVALITPNTYMTQSKYKDLRGLLLRHSIQYIVNLGDGVFDQAIVPTAITSILRKKPKKDNQLRFIDFTQQSQFTLDQIPELTVVVEQKTFQETPKNNFMPEYRRLQEDEELLGEILQCRDAGVQYASPGKGLLSKGTTKIGQRLLYSGQKRDAQDIGLLVGRDVFRWQVNTSISHFLRKNYDEILDRESGEWLHYTDFIFDAPSRIIWRQTSDKIIATIDTSRLWFKKTVHGAVYFPDRESDYVLEYLLGLLNSKYLNYLYMNLSGEQGQVFAQIKIKKMRMLPIKKISLEEQKPIVVLVQKLLETEGQGKDVAIWEHELNRLVYDLYELTSDEKALVEATIGRE